MLLFLCTFRQHGQKPNTHISVFSCFSGAFLRVGPWCLTCRPVHRVLQLAPTIPTRQTGLVSLGTGTCDSAGSSACTGDVWLTRATCSASPRPGLQTDPALGRLPKERAWPSRTCWPSGCISGDTKCRNEDNCESPVLGHAHLLIFFFRTACVFTKACLAAPVLLLRTATTVVF